MRPRCLVIDDVRFYWKSSSTQSSSSFVSVATGRSASTESRGWHELGESDFGWEIVEFGIFPAFRAVVYGSDFILLGDGQEEDRARIAELLLQRMEYANRAAAGGPSSSQSFREHLGGHPNIPGGAMDFSQSRAPLQPHTKTQPQFEPSIRQSQSSRNEFSDQESFDKLKTASVRTTSMDFSSHTQPKRTSFSRESDEDMGISSSSTRAAVSISTSEPRTSDSWTSGSGGRPIREPSVESSDFIQGRPQKEAAPQPPRQSSLVNNFETRTLDSCGSGTASTNSAASTNIFDSSMNIFQPQVQSKSSISTFQSQSQERDTAGSMKFDMSSMDFARSALGSQHNDPWSVPPSSASVSQTSQIPSVLTTSSPSSATVTTSVAPRSSQTSQQSVGNPDDTDDTMKNLRKTFAGIFGDI
ncbi:unnamed protein product [Taenia asiatica]|uniref:Synapsin n=1 Tax=Taenia asiatica TaxID=60517 RepID=A0A0R3WEB1_TAEAS|nr:unnamed protein product [Taenia asiatica]